MAYRYVRAPVETLIPDPRTPYVDIHDIFGDCMDYIVPDPDAPVQNILFNSDHGLGKTLMCAHLIKKLSEHLGYPVPLMVHDCSEDDRSWMFNGSPKDEGGEHVFELGPFPAVIDMANEVGYAALLLDELSALSPGSQKAVNKMTDWRDGIYITEAGTHFKLKPGATVVILATMNPSTYGGVYTLNKDLRDRFSEEVLTAPDEDQMVEILRQVCPWASTSLVKKASQLANELSSEALEENLSTRALVKFLEKAKRKKWVLDAPLRSIANKYEGSERNTVIDRINGIFNVRVGGKGQGTATYV
tara:strand:+ start:139 stop:1044 length:906 start_codon:yes stop_codon:yes gene_type:complete